MKLSVQEHTRLPQHEQVCALDSHLYLLLSLLLTLVVISCVQHLQAEHGGTFFREMQEA